MSVFNKNSALTPEIIFNRNFVDRMVEFSDLFSEEYIALANILDMETKQKIIATIEATVEASYGRALLDNIHMNIEDEDN